MRFREYMKEYLGWLIVYLGMVCMFGFFFYSLHLELAFLLLYFFFFCGFGMFVFFFLFFRKKRFYDTFFSILHQLPSKYLISEMDVSPTFLEAQKMMDALYEIDKSMNEHLNELGIANQNFREYVEMWIHEVKIPIANLFLMFHNSEQSDQKVISQLSRLDQLVEQVLFYVRSETVECDYLIRSCILKDVVHDVVKKNKESFIFQHIAIDVSSVSHTVLTDVKWLTFILNQILSNSLKYHKKEDAKVKISSSFDGEQVILSIWDNGIGIPSSEIARVFDKSFTGSNGRLVSNSTGMGLFIVRNLIHKLGHQIRIESKLNEYTLVQIIFSKHDYYDVIDK